MPFRLNPSILLLILIALGCKQSNVTEFTLSGKNEPTAIYYDENADSLILWAINDLARDIEKITGTRPTVGSRKIVQKGRGIYIGEFNDPLMETIKLDQLNSLNGGWEKFYINVYQGNLIISGSDIRGTVYGMFEVAERLGISPWKWWADVEPQAKESLSLKIEEGGITESPSVQYRGIFLNDEDWGLQPWAAKTFEPETGDIGPKTYEKIFQLLLSLKANTIWPAMHPSTKAFFSIPGNKEMAEKYHIFIGTSHAEPMLRNNVDEWDKEAYGEFNYFTNSQKVMEYWQARIAETKNGNNIITLGMRGIHDSGMEGNATQGEKVSLLENILTDQREMLSKTINKPIAEIPQVLTLYKEVLDIYNSGLNVPDDVTLMWTDDNYGYVRRLSSEAEQKRSGGSGVYYHLSYWGRPHDYLWLSTTQPGLIWYEMSRAYHNGAQKIWIANVGDIKPGEYNMEFFLDLAWDISSMDETSIKKHLHDWNTREFGTEKAAEISDVLQEYYRLAVLRKPEYMGWSQTEPRTATRISEFSAASSNYEVQRRIDGYSGLIRKVDAIKSSISKERMDAYFQLVEYPVKGAALMNFKFLFAQQAFLSSDSADKEKLANQSQEAYDEIITLTAKYNNEISAAKWQEMMSMNPRNLAAYAMPTYHLSDSSVNHTQFTEDQTMDPIFIQANEFLQVENRNEYRWISIEGLGYSNSSITLFPFDNYIFEKNEPFVEYKFNLENPGKYIVEIRCLPTHANNYDHSIRVEVNDNEPRSFSVNTKGRSKAWKENVLRNYVSIESPAAFNSAGEQTLKIYINQSGIVIDQIAIIPDSYQNFYEIVN